MMNISEAIKRKRQSLGISVADLSSILQLKLESIYKWEKGTEPQDGEAIKKLKAFTAGEYDQHPLVEAKKLKRGTMLQFNTDGLSIDPGLNDINSLKDKYIIQLEKNQQLNDKYTQLLEENLNGIKTNLNVLQENAKASSAFQISFLEDILLSVAKGDKQAVLKNAYSKGLDKMKKAALTDTQEILSTSNM